MRIGKAFCVLASIVRWCALIEKPACPPASSQPPGLKCFRSSKTDPTRFGLETQAQDCCATTGELEASEGTVTTQRIPRACAAVSLSDCSSTTPEGFGPQP